MEPLTFSSKWNWPRLRLVCRPQTSKPAAEQRGPRGVGHRSLQGGREDAPGQLRLQLFQRHQGQLRRPGQTVNSSAASFLSKRRVWCKRGRLNINMLDFLGLLILILLNGFQDFIFFLMLKSGKKFGLQGTHSCCWQELSEGWVFQLLLCLPSLCVSLSCLLTRFLNISDQ